MCFSLGQKGADHLDPLPSGPASDKCCRPINISLLQTRKKNGSLIVCKYILNSPRRTKRTKRSHRTIAHNIEIVCLCMTPCWSSSHLRLRFLGGICSTLLLLHKAILILTTPTLYAMMKTMTTAAKRSYSNFKMPCYTYRRLSAVLRDLLGVTSEAYPVERRDEGTKKTIPKHGQTTVITGELSVSSHHMQICGRLL